MKTQPKPYEVTPNKKKPKGKRPRSPSSAAVSAPAAEEPSAVTPLAPLADSTPPTDAVMATTPSTGTVDTGTGFAASSSVAATSSDAPECSSSSNVVVSTPPKDGSASPRAEYTPKPRPPGTPEKGDYCRDWKVQVTHGGHVHFEIEMRCLRSSLSRDLTNLKNNYKANAVLWACRMAEEQREEARESAKEVKIENADLKEQIRQLLAERAVRELQNVQFIDGDDEEEPLVVEEAPPKNKPAANAENANADQDALGKATE